MFCSGPGSESMESRRIISCLGIREVKSDRSSRLEAYQ